MNQTRQSNLVTNIALIESVRDFLFQYFIIIYEFIIVFPFNFDSILINCILFLFINN